MRSGQRKARNKEPFYKKVQKKIFPHSYLENELIHLDRLNEASRGLWKEYQNYLAGEREKVLDKIIDALIRTSTADFSINPAGRIISSGFSITPLSCRGSYLCPPGGRFNFGQSVSYQRYFPALYVSNSYNVAFFEKFKQEEANYPEEELTGPDLALRRPDSFSYQRVRLFLDRIIDLRRPEPTTEFYEIIKHIKIPNIYQMQAKKLNVPMGIIKDSEGFKKAIFEPNYEQWDYWIDCPSTSQWFGHYVRLAGIQGVIYPSIRLMYRLAGIQGVIYPNY